MNRRKFITQAVGMLAPVSAFPFINKNRFKLFPFSDTEYSARAIDLVRESVVVDMLNQFNFPGTELDQWLDRPDTFRASAQKYKDSGIDVFALGHAQENRERSLDYFTKWNRFISENSQSLHRIDTPEDLHYVNETGKTGVMLTFQDSRHFESLADVELFYNMGQRLSQLTYNYGNKIGSGGFDEKDNGLTEYGKQIVVEMNNSGMAIDLSHCSDRTTSEGIELSSKPVIITHANCRALNPGHPRAKTDEMIKSLAAKGGLFGVAEIRFMVRDREPVTIEHFLDHYDHLIKLVGPEHAGIGTDFDLDTDDGRIPFDERREMFADSTGERYKKYRMHSNDQYLIGVEGINHPKRTYDIVEGFIRRGYSDQTIKMILGENFIRVAKEIWK
ncbi:MAG: membrane dipeptidase [Cyclobacteriaceae bacterium]|nr:membrane dipeptidase [Cyclobacteriaceae bacterium]